MNKRRVVRSWCIGVLAAIAVILAIGCARTALAQAGSMQTETSSKADQPLPSFPRPRFVENSLSLGTFAQLTADRLSTKQSLDPSAGVLGTWRQAFWPWMGYSLNLGYTRTTEHAAYDAVSSQRIPADVYETSLSYLLENHITSRLTGFVDVGAGMLTFLPVHRGADAIDYVPHGYRSLVPSVTFRPLGVGAIGVEYRYTRHIALRAEYRGLIYKYPDYGTGLGRAVTVSSEPTLSLVYSFGGRAENTSPHGAK